MSNKKYKRTSVKSDNKLVSSISSISRVFSERRMGKNQAYKAMQRARIGSASGANDSEDGMADGSFHSPEWHAARLASLHTSHTITWEEYKRKQKEDEIKNGEVEADKDRMMREYRAQLDKERAQKLAHGRNHSRHSSHSKKEKKDKDSKKRSKRKRKHRRSSESSSSDSSSSESSSSESEDEGRDSKRSRSKSKSKKKRKEKRKHRSRSRTKHSDSSENEKSGDGPVPLSKFFGTTKD